MFQKNKKISILGGGTAGWLTALVAKKFYPNHTVELIESEEIGILGAGEGTFFTFINLLDFINIPVSDIIKECKATIKNGISFTNWSGTGETYYHDFTSSSSLSEVAFDEGHLQNIWPIVHLSYGGHVNDLGLNNKLSKQYKVPFTYLSSPQDVSNPIFNLENYGGFGLHFDARLLAKFLSKVAQERGVRRIEGRVEKVENDKQGNISKLFLNDNRIIPIDFIFDCSGFSRLLIGKHYSSEWLSYQKHLPMKAAVPFFIPHDGKVMPETQSIAMKYGWIWKIPVQDRYGCGYVFDSDYINADQALQEAEEYFGMKLESPKSFKFNAGTFKESYIKNCLAVGLSQSFMEPLEASSIYVTSNILLKFLQANGIYNDSSKFREEMNEYCVDINQDIMDFIYIHYLTKRNDSAFWKEFREKNSMPDRVKYNIDQLNQTPMKPVINQTIGTLAWQKVADGVGLIDIESFTRIKDCFDLESKICKTKLQYLADQHSLIIDNALSHQEFINYLMKS